MSSNLIKQPYEMILDPTGGGGRAKPVANGKFYVGEIDKDPVANPRTDIAYKDESGQERPLASPLTLNNSGAFVVSENDGTIIQPYMKDGVGFSVLITDSRGRDVYSDLNTGDPGNLEPAIDEYLPKYLDKYLNDFTDIVYSSSSDKTAVENMINNSNLNEKCTCENGSRFKRVSLDGGDITDFDVMSTLNFIDFGADPEGMEDSTKAIKDAFALGFYLEQNHGKFKISGSENIEISSSFDCSGCELVIDGFSGQFIIDRNETITEYLPGTAVINAIEASTNLKDGTADFDGLKVRGITDIDGCYIIMELNQDFYNYRGSVVKRKEHNYLANKGILGSPIKYGIEGLSITKLTAMKISPTKMKCAFNFIERNANNLPEFGVLVKCLNSSRVNISASFMGADGQKVELTSNLVRLKVDNCPFFRVNSLFTDIPVDNADRSYGYTINMNDCYNIIMNDMNSDGYGWGVEGSDENQKITIRDSSVNRIDAHKIFKESLNIINTTISNWGVTVSGTGDIFLDNVSHTRKSASLRNPSFIKTRFDSGGFVDGNIKGSVKVYGRDGIDHPDILVSDCNDDYSLPSSSPISNRFFNEVDIDVSIPQSRAGMKLMYVNDYSQTKKTLAPSKVRFRVRQNQGDLSIASPALAVVNIDLSRMAPSNGIAESNPRSGDYNMDIELDCSADFVVFPNASAEICPRVKLRNLQGTVRQQRPILQCDQRARYDIIDGDIAKISSSTNIPVFFVFGGRWKALTSTDNPNQILDVKGGYVECQGVDQISRATSHKLAWQK